MSGRTGAQEQYLLSVHAIHAYGDIHGAIADGALFNWASVNRVELWRIV